MRITDALRGEHGAFYAQFDRLEEVLPHTPSAGEVREQAALLAAALVSHARLEDEVLFRPMARAGGDPGRLATMEEEHTRIAELLSRAQGTHDLWLARAALLEAVAIAREHFAREERLAFPLAESLLDREELVASGGIWADRRTVFVAGPGD